MSLENLLKSVEKYSPKRYSAVLILPILALITGFFIWNIYLYSLGFIINDLLRTRFILTGILFILITITIYSLAKGLTKNIDTSIDSNRTKTLFYGFLLLVWFLIYSIFLFPMLPLVIGGGQPKALGLIINENSVMLLKSLDLKLADGAKYQTENTCVAYEGANNLLILMENRIILLDKSLITGFVSLPGINATVEQICISRASQWAKKGFFSSTILSILTTYNSFANLVKLPSISFSTL